MAMHALLSSFSRRRGLLLYSVLACLLCLVPRSHSEEIEIPDPWLEGAIRMELGQWDWDFFHWDYEAAPPLTRADMESLTALRVETGTVVSLEGIQAAVNLEELDCYGVTIRGGLWGPGIHGFIPVLGANGGGGVDFSPLVALPKLKRLVLSGNGLESVATLAGQQSLEVLDLSENLIDVPSLEEVLESLPKLKALQLRTCFIEVFSPKGELRNLESLDLSDNPLRVLRLPEGWWGLKELRLRSTKLRDLSVLAHLGTLEVLDVSDGGVVGFNALRQVETSQPPLKILDLSGSGIQGSLRGGDALLGSLELLNLDGNQLSNVPESYRSAVMAGSSPETVQSLTFVKEPSGPHRQPVSDAPILISSTGQSVDLKVNGFTGQVLVEASPDLSEWTLLKRLEGGELTPALSLKPSEGSQFFRARAVEPSLPEERE